ncbi:MAG: hypothetical protein LHW51_07740 [Candidatus Cloacimonetes bacterium]|nr:hypothetical protein [Candidatus Cloacimonadota bacterium]MCK9242766.1 hypothetical protein [Candidatus Cloacimonadota bacterium]
MLAEKTHPNFSFDENDHACYLGNASVDKHDIDKIRALLADNYPFADFDKLLDDADRRKHRIVVDNDNIKIGESGKEIPIKSLIPEDFQMLICYKPKECIVLLHKPLSVKLKHDSIEGLIKGQLIEDYNSSEEDKFHIISWDKESGSFKHDVKDYLRWGEQISIEFTRVGELESRAKEKLAAYNSLSDISPFYTIEKSKEDLINKVRGLFHDTPKSENTTQKPTLVIKLSAIEFLAGDKPPCKLHDFNRYKEEDEIAKDLNSLFKSVHEYRNKISGSQNENSNETAANFRGNQSAGITQVDNKTAPSGENLEVESKQELPVPGNSPQKPHEGRDNPIIESSELKVEKHKQISAAPHFDKYYTHLKPVKNEDGVAKFSLGIAGGHPSDSAIEKIINKNQAFSELIHELEILFFPGESGRLTDAIAERVITQQVNLNFSRNTSGGSQSWSVEVSGNFTKEESERKQQELKKREEKVAEREKRIADQETARKQLQNLANQIRLEFVIDEETDVLPHVRELKKTSEKAISDFSELKHITDQLDQDLHSLKTKFESLTTHLSDFTADDHGLDKIGAAQFDNLLHRLKDSYVKLESINNLRGYDGADLKAFSCAFGDVKSYIVDAVDKMEKSFTSINEKFVVCDAIRSRLSNPELRKLKLPSLDAINQELEHYGLCIFLPAQDVPAEPSRHKVVGYEIGGVRGTISSIVSWGVMETRADGTIGTTIFKAEVKIYQ